MSTARIQQAAHKLRTDQVPGISHLSLCSMGGVLIKDLLARAASPAAAPHHRRLAANTVGLVFFACPHRGSWLANLGW